MAARLLATLLLALAVPAWANPCALPEGRMPFASGMGGTGIGTGMGGTGVTPHDSGIGGTGITPHGTGMGGTGVTAQGTGMGGTGIAPHGTGMGGTGIAPHGTGLGGTGVTAQGTGMGGTGIAPHGTGMGGTGVTAQGSGMGGTGIAPHGTGMGGTGSVADGSGMGGTGVVGIITGFGSICVNGLEIHYDANTPVSVDGRAGSPKQLAIGQWVAVQAAGTAPSLMARRIELNSAVVGPVDWVAPGGQSFRVLGQSVLAMTGGKVPRAGEFVRVDGVSDANGTIQATHIERLPSRATVSVSGIVKAVSGKTVRVGGLTAVGVTGLSVGAPVRLTGRLTESGTLEARQVDIAPEMRSIGKAERMVLQGIVHEADAKGVSLGYARVETSNFAAQRVEPGQWVRVEVMRRPDGRLDAGRWSIDTPRGGRDAEAHRGGRERGQDRDASGHERESSDDRHEGERRENRESPEKGEQHDKRPGLEKGREFERFDKPEKIDTPEKTELPERPESVEGRDD
ncbi:MAG: DUF5666 domain-containing protein [Hydrogenophilaceae bacterium]